MSFNKNSVSELPHYEVTAGLIQNNGKILITQRRFDDTFGGLWELPGGKQEAGETLERCLIREINEELNYNLTPLKNAWQQAYQNNSGTIIIWLEGFSESIYYEF